MRLIFLVLLGLAASVTAAEAVSDKAMEAQRCIWSCGEATGLRQPAYNQCIARQCDTAPKKRKRRP
jgi:hypothetical protein